MVLVGLSDDEDDDMIGSSEEVGVVAPQAKRVAQDSGSPDDSGEDDDSEEMSDESVDQGYQGRGPMGLSDDDEWEEEEEEEEGEEAAGDEYFPSMSLNESAMALALPQQLGLDAAKVQIMNSVLFDSEYTDQDGIRRVARFDGLRPRSRHMLRSLSSPQRLADAGEGLQPMESDAPPPRKKQQHGVDTARVVCAPELRLCNQPGIAEHRSALMQASRRGFVFGAGFGPQGQFVTAGNAELDARVTVARLRGEGSTAAAVEALLLHKAHFWDARDAGTTEEVLADSFVKQSAQAAALGEEERSCWRLIDALWGDVEENGDPNPHHEAIVRRRLVSEWLERATRDTVDREVAVAGESVPGRVLALLSGHRVKEAVDECIRHRYLRLAAIVAACATTHESKYCLSQQEWSKQFVDVEERLACQMLSGGNDEFFASTQLGWIRNFGVFLWYRFAWDRPLASVFRAFENFVRKSGVEVSDFRYNLLRLFADPSRPLQEVLVPESYGTNPLNWRLAYTTRFALSRLPQRASAEGRLVVPLASDATTGARLASRFAEQLEQMGLWQWAVYVLIAEPHLALPAKQAAVRALLERSSGSTMLREEGSDAFVEALGVEWVSRELAAAKRLFEGRLTSPLAAAMLQGDGHAQLVDAMELYLACVK